MVAILRSLVIAAQAILPLNTAKDQASQTVIKLNFTDELVRPTPPSHYVRYVTYLNIGQRTYQCDIANETSPYRFKSFDYEMFDAEVDPHHHMVGRHVMSQDLLASAGAGSIFYTTNATFTYWVGRGTKAVDDPLAGPSGIGLEQTLKAESSEPKAAAGKYDLGIAVYATRFGAVNGLVPPGTKCTGDRTVKSTVYFSMWKQVL